MINLYEKFCELNSNIKNSQYVINTRGTVKIYYGINTDGCFRLSFLSSKPSGIKDMTKNISVVHGNNLEENNWTCFDLINNDLISVFCSFGEDLISSVIDEMNEVNALNNLRLRYNTWLALFKKNRSLMSPEKAKGLFGELFFLKNTMIDKYGVNTSIKSWSGPDFFTKDFAVNNTWYEIKTTSCISTVIHITSLQQISSDLVGRLIIIKVEEMADAYNGKDSSINELIQYIISKIDDNDIKDEFLIKLSNVGYDFTDVLGDKKYNVALVERYVVNSEFPAIREKDIKSTAISNVGYDLVIKLLSDFLER